MWRVTLNDEYLGQPSFQDHARYRNVVSRGNVHRTNMWDRSWHERAGNRACFPTPERKSGEVRDVEGGGFRHYGANSRCVIEHVNGIARHKFDRDSHRSTRGSTLHSKKERGYWAWI